MANSNNKSVLNRPATEVTSATKNYYEKYGDAVTARSIVGRLLKFNKFGEFHAGQEDETIPLGTPLAVYMTTLEAGYVRWEDGRPAGYEMGRIGEGFQPKPRAELGYLDQSQWETDDKSGKPRDPWQFSNSVVLVSQASGEHYTFSTSSKGGLGAIGELAKAYGKHIRVAPDEMPVVELAMGSYRHPNREYGEIRYPMFKVTSYVPLDRLPPLDGSASDDEAEDPEGMLALPEPQEPSAPEPEREPGPGSRI